MLNFSGSPETEVTKILITEFMDEAAVDDLRRDFEVYFDPGLVDKPDELLTRIIDADGLVVRNRTPVRGALLAQARNLRVVGRLGVGLDNIDVAECDRRGITVCPATGANDTAVAEYVIATAMFLLRGCFRADAAVIAGDWPRQLCVGREILGKTLGLVGLGGIARQTADRARALGMNITAHDPFVAGDDAAWNGVQNVQLRSVFAHADVVSIHVPLNGTTRGLVNAALLANMKPEAVLINTARGGIVDEQAVIDALVAGRLGGAALDVYAIEPLTAAAGSRFRNVPNLILTPHIAGITEESNVRVSAVTAGNMKRVLPSS